MRTMCTDVMHGCMHVHAWERGGGEKRILEDSSTKMVGMAFQDVVWENLPQRLS